MTRFPRHLQGEDEDDATLPEKRTLRHAQGFCKSRQCRLFSANFPDKKKPLRPNAEGATKPKLNNAAQGKPRSLLTRTALSWVSLGIIFATTSAFMAFRISTTSSSSILSSRGATLDGLMALYILTRFLNC